MEYIRELKADKFKDVFLHSNFMYGLPEDSLEGLKEMHYKLIDTNYNKLDQIVVQSYTIRSPQPDYPKSDPTKTTSNIQANLEEEGYTITTDRKVWETILMTKNKHGLSTQQSHHIADQTTKQFRQNKYWANYFDPVKTSNDLRYQMHNDYTEYFDKLFKIQKHNKYESVTLFDGETPTTLSVQEYKESL